MWWPVFNFLRELGPWSGTQIIGFYSNVTVTETGMAGLLSATEQSILGVVFSTLTVQLEDISFMSKMGMVLGNLVLSLVYIILVWNMIKGVLFSSFKIAAVGLIAPFLVFSFAFSETRIYTISAVRILVTAAFELILASSAVAVVLYLMSTVERLFTESVPFEGVNATFGSEYMVVLGTGLAMTVVHSVFMEVAGQITMTFGQNYSGHAKSVISSLARIPGR